MKERKRRMQAYSVFSDMPYGKVFEFFKSPQIIKVFAGKAPYKWNNKFLAENLEHTSPWLVKISKEVDRIGKDFDCRELAKNLLLREAIDDGKLDGNYADILDVLGVDLKLHFQRDEEGFILFPSELLLVELDSIAKKAEASRFIKKLNRPWLAQVQYQDSQLLSWQSEGIEKDRRPDSLWNTVDEALRSQPREAANISVDISGILTLASLQQINLFLNNPSDEKIEDLLKRYPGLALWAEHFDFDLDLMYGTFLADEKSRIEKMFASQGMLGQIAMVPVFRELRGILAVSDFSNEPGNVSISFDFDSLPSDSEASRQKAVKLCLELLRKEYNFKNAAVRDIGEAESIGPGMTIPSSLSFQVVVDIKHMGPSSHVINSWARLK